MISHQICKSIYMLRKALVIIAVSLLLFLAGMWVFNHCPYPVIGLVIAFIYPISLIWLYLKRKNL